MNEQADFPIQDVNRVRRVAKRAHYDRQQVFEIFDQALLCHVSFVEGDGPVAIPMLHARIDDRLIFHGSSKSRLMMKLAEGMPVCLSVAMADGLVLARSLFHHSMNYRSAVAFGRGHVIDDETQRMEGLRAISDKIMPQRWDDARLPTPLEMKATMVCAVSIDVASAKIRTGGPVDDEADYDLDFWAGTVPLRMIAEPPVADPQARKPVPVPEYIGDFVRNFRG